MSEEPPAEETNTDSKEKKKGCRSCLGRLAVVALVLLALLAAGLLWITGPGLNWVAQKYLPDLLEKAGFEGEVAFSGSLLTGPTIERLSLQSETSPLKSLQARNLTLDYSLKDLLSKKVDAVTADSLTLDLDLAQTDPNAEPKPEKEPSDKTLAETLDGLRDLVRHPRIAIADLNVHLHKGEQNFYKIANGSLNHPAGGADFLLDVGTLTDFQDQVTTPPITTLSWLEEEFRIASLPLAEDLSIPVLTLNIEPLLADGRVRVFGSDLEMESDLRSRASTRLLKGPIALEPFFALVPDLENYEAALSTLSVDAAGIDQDFSKWKIDFDLGIEKLVVDGREVPRTDLTIQKEDLAMRTVLAFQLPEQSPALEVDTTFAAATADSPQEAWKNSSSQIVTEFSSLGRLLEGLQPLLQLPTPPDGWPQGRAQLDAQLNLREGNPVDSTVALSFEQLNWAEARLRDGSLRVRYPDAESPLEAELTIAQSEKSTLTSQATYDLETQGYDANFEVNSFDASALAPFIRLSAGDIPLSGVINLAWQGQGSLKDASSHQGALSLSRTRLAVQKQPEVVLNLQAQYEGLEQIELTKLEAFQQDQRLLTEMNWDGERVEVPSITISKAGRNLLSGELSIPYRVGQEPADYFSNEESWSLKLNADRLNIPETGQLFALPIPEGLQGVITVDTTIAGSPARPSLSGRVRVDDFSLSSVEALPPTDVALAWASAGKTLTLDGTVTPEGRNAITVTANTAFAPKKWAEDPESLLKENFNARILASEVDLAPFADLSPLVRSLKGSASLEVIADGTFHSPDIRGSASVDLPRARLEIERLRRIRDTSLQVKFQRDLIRIEPSTLSLDGGVIKLSGAVGIQDTTNPTFDINLTGEQVLLWRDDNVNARADADLRLAGPLDKLSLEGDIGIVESLFYKDIELLPLNVPVSVPKAPKIGSLSKPKAVKAGSASKLPIPPPFGDCTLRVRAYTKDPFLVRGNLTEGQVTGEIFGTGVLSDPQLNGALTIDDFSAALPFSTLTIDGGQAIFSPKNGFIPALDIKAESKIAPYTVNLFVAGKATSPNVSFASNPPLPENEVITLLATGTTSSGLEDADAAKGKAFQLLIEQVRRAPPGSPLHPLAKYAEPLKDVEIQVSGADPFTGKRRNSVTLPLPGSDRWAVTAAVDSESNTRGLVVYLLRFD